MATNRIAAELIARIPVGSAKELIQSFDVDFDVPLQRSVGLGLLEMLGAFDEREGETGEQLAVRVGAWWGRIVHHDVEYRLLHGLEAIDDSRPAAERLRDGVEKKSDFEAYAAARWHDGAGKINFRCGDMMTARELFAQAAKIAERDALWYCRPDILSNLRRAEFDESSNAHGNTNVRQLDAAFAALLASSLELAAEERHPVPVAKIEETFKARLDALRSAPDVAAALPTQAGDLAVLLGADDTRKREYLRGLASVLHNASIVRKSRGVDAALDLGAALDLSERSAAIAFALGDEYRVAQALRERSFLLVSRHPTGSAPWELGRQLLDVVRGLAWRRGRWMATQKLATIVGVPLGPEMLKAVFVELEQRQRQRGGDLGFDVDVHRYTVDALEAIEGVTPEVRKLRLEAARNVRRVVKVSTYRQQYAEAMFPVYMEAIHDKVVDLPAARSAGGTTRAEHLEDLTALIEEASARELLDLLETNRRAGGEKAPGGAEDAIPTKVPLDQRVVRRSGLPAARDLSTREAFRESRPAHEAIALARLEFEREALHRPIAAAPHEQDIAAVLRRLSAQQEGLAVVRYFLEKRVGPDEKGKPRAFPAIHAMVFRHGATAVELRPVVREEAYRAFEELAALPHHQGPSADRARLLWQILIEPIWSAVCDGEGRLPAHLVLIPTTGMFGLPLHAALVPASARKPEGLPGEVPLAAVLPLSFSVSATAFAARRRYLLCVQPVDASDDLCALVPGDPDVYPGELLDVRWNDPEHFHLAGFRPEGLDPATFQDAGDGDKKGLERLLRHRAEFFVYAGHGCSVRDRAAVEVALKLANDDYLTQYDLVRSHLFQSNKLTILGACVSGQGGDTASGEVSGFLRSFMAAGAGALCVTLWRVRNDAIAHVGRELLRVAARCKDNARRRSEGQQDPAQPAPEVNLDIVRRLHEIQRDAFAEALARAAPAGAARDLEPDASAAGSPLGEALHACPIAVYL